MREVNTNELFQTIYELCSVANRELTDDVVEAINTARHTERSQLGTYVLDQIMDNARVAAAENMALCQDTGMVVVFLEIGQAVVFTGDFFENVINEAIRQSYRDHHFRTSVVADPLVRNNTGDNTPAVIHTRLVPGEQIRIRLAPKGFGSENMSAVRMLRPVDGAEGIKQFVVDTVRKAGGNPCPPVVVGVGLGGTLEKAAILAKEALLRPVSSTHSAPHIASLERELLSLINQTGIGPQGFGGDATALGVNIEVFPTHIAGLPAAVNLNCHVARHREAVI